MTQAFDSDLALLERVRRGDPAALGETYDLHHTALRGFAARLVGDAAIAEDLVHDAFAALPRAARGFRGESSLRTFLMSIAANLARRHIRAASRRRRRIARLADEPLGHPADPEHEAIRRELAEALTRALDGLSVAHRLAFVLCELEQLSSREAAGVLGVPEGTVRSRLHHARERLRAALEAGGHR